MKRVLAAAVLLFASCGQPALAWDPNWPDSFDPGPIDRQPDPAPYVVPEGLYVVTDVYAGDVVARQGDTTTYSTQTVRETPGTYARVVDVVGTGGSSAFDGSSFNGRSTNSSGQGVGGTYYEDFVLTTSGFVSVNVVFFQDDSETRRDAAPPSASPSASPAPPAIVPTPRATPGPITSNPPFVPQATAEPVRDRETPTASARAGSAAIALGQAAATLGRIEVLRGRRVTLWPRAFVDGSAVPIRSWRLVSGTVSGTCAGSGTTPSCDASWLTLAPAGSSFQLRFEVATDALPGAVLVATLEVVVRSPALEQ